MAKLEEYKKHRYNTWAGNPKGIPYKPNQCAETVRQNWLSFQCSRKNGHGPEGLYCKQHAKTKAGAQ